MLLAVEGGVQAQGDTDQDAGDEASHEEGADGSTGSHAVHNHGDGGGDNDADGTSSGSDGAGVVLVIILLEHAGDSQTTDSSHGSRAGTGNSSEEHAGHDGDQGKTAVFPAQEGVSDVEQTAGNTAGCHQLAGQHEERHGHQGERVGTGYQALSQIGGLNDSAGHNGNKTGQTQRDANRNAENQKQREASKQNCNFHNFLFLLSQDSHSFTVMA